MSDWKPIETLTDRAPCRDYLVFAEGRPRLLWWCAEDDGWIGDSDREGTIPSSCVTHWTPLPAPPPKD